VGFEDSMAEVVCAHPRVDLSLTGLAKKVEDGHLVDA